MQEIQIYATASETVATVRDYANAKTVSAPSFVLGVSAKIKLTLFANMNNPLPLPMSELSNIVGWSFVMDNDFDTATDYKVVADNGNITVTGAETDGEKYTEDPEDEDYDPELAGEYIPTVFTIPLPDMNSTTLNEWIGTAASKGGLIGELVGYDSNGASVFILQIEGFTVRNRITGSGEPTSTEADEYLTLNEARALFLNDSKAMRPFLDVEVLGGGNSLVDGHYTFYDAYKIRSTVRKSVFVRDDDQAFVQYVDSYNGWVIYSAKDNAPVTARYCFPWIQTASNPGPITGNYYNISNPSGYTASVNVVTRYNIAAQTY